MQLTAELSLYPLSENYIEIVLSFIAELEKEQGLTTRRNAMSTQISGDSKLVMNTIERLLMRSFERFGRQVLTAKFIPGDFDLDG
ncbi:MAG: hypothetical protein RI942_2580 [Pseudomonadota bacterium]